MAGRNNKNTVDYFPHYVVSGKTMFVLESKYGHTGYAVWFKTLEMLGSNDNHYIDLRAEDDLLFVLSKFNLSEEELREMYNLLSKLGAIDSFLWSKDIVYSENFVSNISDAYKRRSGNCLDGDELYKLLGVKKKAPGKKTSVSKLEKFKSDVYKFSDKYTKEMLDDFFSYWTEPDKNGRLKFELQRTFGISRRLSNWKKKSDNFEKANGGKPGYNLSFSS